MRGLILLVAVPLLSSWLHTLPKIGQMVVKRFDMFSPILLVARFKTTYATRRPAGLLLPGFRSLGGKVVCCFMISVLNKARWFDGASK